MTLEEIITTRRSVRSFTEKGVSKEALLKLLDMARWAPYACECWRFVVVQEEERKRQLARAAGQSWIAGAPAIIVVGADIEGRAQRNRELYCIQDTAAAIQNLMLGAVDEGLGTCWIGSFDEKEVGKIVGFPEGIRAVAMVPVGHPKSPQGKGRRKSLDEVVFWEAY